jgi:intracellular septation protein A
MMRTLSVDRPNVLAEPMVRVMAATLGGVLLLYLMGKGIAALGNALDLPRACWQLLALRAAAAGLVVGMLARLRLDHLVVFGLAYGAVLMMGHASWVTLVGASVAGLVAFVLRRRWEDRSLAESVVVPVGVFVMLLGAGSAYRAIERGGWDAIGPAAFDLALRGVVGMGMALGVLLLFRLWDGRKTA